MNVQLSGYVLPRRCPPRTLCQRIDSHLPTLTNTYEREEGRKLGRELAVRHFDHSTENPLQHKKRESSSERPNPEMQVEQGECVK